MDPITSSPSGPSGIVIYGKPMCTDCKNAKTIFESVGLRPGIDYQDVDIVATPEAKDVVAGICAEHGITPPRVPVIVFSQFERVFIEPQEEALVDLELAAIAARASMNSERM